MVLKYQHPFNNPDLADGWGSWAGGRSQAHRGLDYAKPSGTDIPAIAAGVIAWNGAEHPALGWIVVVAHSDGMFSGYSHMQVKSPIAVGAAVSRGQIIGKVGQTGSAANGPFGGPHLHLTVTYTEDGTWNNGNINVTTDPNAYINARLNGDDPGTTPTTPSTGENTEMTDIIYYALGTLGPRYSSGGITVETETMWYQECPGAPLFPLSGNVAYHTVASLLEYEGFGATRTADQAKRCATTAAKIGALIALRGTTTKPIGNFS